MPDHTDEAIETDAALAVDLHELALEWAACRRALATVADLTDDELDRFAHDATAALLGMEDE